MPRPDRCSSARSSTPARSSGGTSTNIVRSAPVRRRRCRADDDEAGLGAGEVLDADGHRPRAPTAPRRPATPRRRGPARRPRRRAGRPRRSRTSPAAGAPWSCTHRRHWARPTGWLGDRATAAVVARAPVGAEGDGEHDLLAHLDPLGVVDEDVDGEVDLTLDRVLERHDAEVAVAVLDRLDHRHDGRPGDGVDRRRAGTRARATAWWAKVPSGPRYATRAPGVDVMRPAAGAGGPGRRSSSSGPTDAVGQRVERRHHLVARPRRERAEHLHPGALVPQPADRRPAAAGRSRGPRR